MANPAFLYLIVWGVALLLYYFNFTENIVPINNSGFLLIAFNIIFIIMVGLCFSLVKYNKNSDAANIPKYLHSAEKYMRILLFFWVIGSLFEIFLQGGFPLYWMFKGDGRIYTEFGIPSFHGIMNAMYLQAITAGAYLAFLKKEKKYIYILGFLIFWPIVTFARGIFLSAFIQIAAVFIIMRKLKFSAWIGLFSSAVFAILLFGYVGDMRQEANPFKHLVRIEYADFFASIPSGFLWVYIYITSGLSNLFHNIDILQPVYAFDHTFYNLIPSVLKEFSGLEQRKDLFVLVDDSLNASTFYAAYISDFGIVGAFFTAAFVQICCCSTYLIAQRGRPWGIFSYAVSLQIIVFSIFYDLFFILPVLMQFGFAFIYYIAYKIKIFK